MEADAPLVSKQTGGGRESKIPFWAVIPQTESSLGTFRRTDKTKLTDGWMGVVGHLLLGGRQATFMKHFLSRNGKILLFRQLNVFFDVTLQPDQLFN